MSHGASFVRVPPQSTGKRISTVARVLIQYDNKTGSFGIGSTVTGATSGASGIITSEVTEGFAPNTGLIWLKEVNGTFENNENLEINNVTQASVNITTAYPGHEYDYQNMVITDPENPSFQQRIDRFGATLNTFTDGSPVFGSFGTMSVGEPQSIKDYRFAYDSRPDLFYDQEVGGATVGYETASGTVLLSNGTASGDLAKRTSHFNHPYVPGVGHVAEFSIRCGDSGKNGVRRRWGYYNDNDGVYWELDGTQLNIVLRSSVSGSIIETRIPQDQWNKDSLDGRDSIGFELDPTAPNIYWIDLQWLGSGRIRFGIVEPGGSRITAHIIENANDPTAEFPYMRTATLPIRVEQENTSAAASSSEIRFVCASVKHSSGVKIGGDKHSSSNNTVQTIQTSSGEVPLISIRPKVTMNGILNSSLIRGTSISLANITNTGGAPVAFRLRAGTTDGLTGHNFTSHKPNSIAELDTSSTSIDPNKLHQIVTLFVSADKTEFVQDIAPRDLHSFEAFLKGDNATGIVFTITVEVLGGTNADVIAAINWEEILL